MTKKLFFLPLAAMMLLTGCSSDDVEAGGNGTNKVDASYLTVNIVTASTSNRAARVTGDPNNAADYENGEGNENKVERVRFYFFDENGNIANVKSDGTNYYDWTSIKEEGGETPNVEKKLEATLVIQTKDGDKLPKQIAAVINPNFGGESASLTTLRNKVSDYAVLANGDNKFVMFSSVYAQNGLEMTAATITGDNLKKNPDDAKANPVQLYVERNVAKVRMQSATALGMDNDGKIALKDAKGNDLKDAKGNQIYVQLEGWNVTADVDQEYLGKHINPAWTDAEIFGAGEPWNWAPYYRSFWALNYKDAKNQYGDFEKGSLVKVFNNTKSVYCNENADKNEGYMNRTKVIIPATLINENKEPLTLARYHGINYATDDTYSELKLAVLEILNTLGTYCYDENGTRKQITPADIEFKTAATVGNAKDEENARRYYVYAQLTETAQAKKWYDGDAQTANTIQATDINALLKQEWGKAMIWNEGKTYYFFEIEHLANKPGVVRNHIYDITLKSICGLGTPVYNPSETIYPEKPAEDETYIAAKINILSWRVVNNDVNLEW